jgi:hypothetical protein
VAVWHRSEGDPLDAAEGAAPTGDQAFCVEAGDVLHRRAAEAGVKSAGKYCVDPLIVEDHTFRETPTRYARPGSLQTRRSKKASQNYCRFAGGP